MHDQEIGPPDCANTPNDGPLAASVVQEIELPQRHSETEARIPNAQYEKYVPQYSNGYIWSHALFRSIGLGISLGGLISTSYLVGKWSEEAGVASMSFAVVSSHMTTRHSLFFSDSAFLAWHWFGSRRYAG